MDAQTAALVDRIIQEHFPVANDYSPTQLDLEAAYQLCQRIGAGFDSPPTPFYGETCEKKPEVTGQFICETQASMARKFHIPETCGKKQPAGADLPFVCETQPSFGSTPSKEKAPGGVASFEEESSCEQPRGHFPVFRVCVSWQLKVR
jgi:hypothetical protein